jgi:phenylalanyl-tRNA synthetase alpha chain
MDDISPPAIDINEGNIHPVNQTKNYLLTILRDMGFSEVDGPEIETEKFNFDMLNIKKSNA